MAADSSTDSGSSSSSNTETPSTPPPPSSSPSSSSSSSPTAPSTYSWRLPDGIENDIEQALIKTAIGATVGGVFGMILFKSGRGMRAASIATGVGVAAGSTYERILSNYTTNSSNNNK